MSFSWDCLYVFDSGISKDEMERLLGQRVTGGEEFQRSFVFLLNGRIVHEETTPANIERPLRGEIVFETGEPYGSARVMPGQDYLVTRNGSGIDTYFVLRASK